MAVTHGHGNPAWTWDETVLALDLYLECGGHIPPTSDSRVQELSELLRRFPFHAVASRKGSFRNPDGVGFKLQNLHQVATDKGLAHVSAMDHRVWDELGHDPARTKQLATEIRASIGALAQLPESIEAEYESHEGGVVMRLHRQRERDSRLRKKLLKARRKSGALSCDLCSSTAQSSVDALEDAMFEAHHVVPLSASGERISHLDDVALLCANCHRTLHRAITLEKRWLPLDEAPSVCGLS
jgi:5-methylcytosine-specific restriction protein A